MLKQTLDVGLAVLLTGAEMAALALFLFVLGLEKWAAQGQRVADRTGRVFLVLGLGATGSAALSYGCARAGLSATCVAQAVWALLLACVLVVGAGNECWTRIARNRLRRRLRRERLRWHRSQRREEFGHVAAPVRRRRWR
ncbi:hypothetical protein [Streptomyces pilosus]|uniref:Uncharacterized protein n=1 Tax=Streptomyces pilosus TaxID=28893 RepID=A0A918BR83_9ACTN|nr:hypothetical protein GCM10010280_38900 [Streptomyces pilosus]